MVSDYHEQNVKVVLKRNSTIYRKIKKYAIEHGTTVEAVIDSLVTYRLSKHMANNIKEYEK